MPPGRRLAVAAAIVLCAGMPLARPMPARAAPIPGTPCQVFPTDNIWNTDISTLPVNANNGAWLGSTGATSGRLLHPDFGQPPYGIPFTVVDNTHALVTVTLQYASESDPGPYPVGADTQIENGSDHHALIVNRNTCTLYELFGLSGSGSSWTAGSGAIFPLGSDALRPAGWTSADAAGLPILPGLVRLDEVQAGVISHAIRFTVVNSDTSYLWPARHQAGSAHDPALPPMGARFRLNANFDTSSFGTEAKVVLTAMKHYGLIVADNGSNWYFQGTEDAGWNLGPYPAMVADLKRVPASAFEAIDESALMVDPNSGQVGVSGAPTNVMATTSAVVSWTAPASQGATAISSYVVTAYDGCTIQGSMTVSGAPPATSVTFPGLSNGSAYTFKVAAVNSHGAGPQSSASSVVVLVGATTSVTACSASQYTLAGNNGSTWVDMDANHLGVSFTPTVNSFAIVSANADLWTASAGFNQDLGVAVNGGGVYPTTPGQPEAWKESGGFAGTFSPNAAFVHTVIPVLAGTTYSAKVQWKANLAGSGSIFAGAGPIGNAFSPTRLAVQLVPTAAQIVFSKSSTSQYFLNGSNGSTWQNIDATNLSVGIPVPPGNWLALVSGNADLWTSSAGYNQDLGVSLVGGVYPTTPGQPEVWKESGGFAGTFSPNAAFVQASLNVVGGVPYTAKLQWKANRPDPGSIYAGAGPVNAHFSPTSLTVILIPSPAGAVVMSSTLQYHLANSDGSTWQAIDASALKLTLAPSVSAAYVISANADLWTSVAGYNQDLGLMVNGGAYGTGTVVAWKEGGGFAGTFSPNAANVATHLNLQGGTTYIVTVVWKANRAVLSPNAIWAGAGPISARFSPTWLTAIPLS